MADRTIRFGSRKSALALAQTKLVMDAVTRAHPELRAELVTMDTTGDRNMKPFSETSDKFGIKGLFTLELEEALTSGAIDIAVHSLKDVPMNANPKLPLVAYSAREDARDALVLPIGRTDIGQGPIGCSSSRRRAQLAEIFPGVPIVPVRGNVNTRLRKLDAGDFSALVLAAAGLHRLGLESRIAKYFKTDEMIPAPGQGIMACQGRAGEDYYYLDAVRDINATACAEAERAFSAELGGGCTAPVGAFATVRYGEIFIIGFCADENCGNIRRGTARGPLYKNKETAAELARKLKRGE